jgi:hypothetical protein
LFIDTNYEDDDYFSDDYTQVIKLQEFEQRLDRGDSIAQLASINRESAYSGISGGMNQALNTSSNRNLSISSAGGMIQYVAKV